ncbi:MAG TPA: HAMP domain-containing sensor histidine kinase [Prolixibacteraceae bacterium]|nr:HAMP domain-containing sensor histidine kinase [Prolixibacteraceae bacterium]
MKFNIRTRLSIQFTYIVTFILILFSFIIYYFSDSYREAEFYSRLEKKALTTAKLLIQVKEVDYNLMKIIDRNTINAINNETVMIFDDKDKLIYNSSDSESIPVSKSLTAKIRQSGSIRSHEGKKEVIGLLYIDKNIQYVVLASALDSYGLKKLSNLKWIIIVGFFISIVMTVYLSKIYATRALKPMSDVVKQVDKINIANMDVRVNEGNGTDEIAQLAITFNKMLERLESAFEMQRSFVSNASHELRTPLTSITGQIEVSLMKSRTHEEYKATLESVLEDIKNLNALSNGLLDLAKASSDISAVALHPLRIDEILWQTRAELMDRKKNYSISINFSEPIEDDRELTVMGNDHLLKTAMANLMDNACKFSADNAVEIILSIRDHCIVAAFSDRGIGIEKDNMENIFLPFFRAENAKNIPGNGLGLSLTDKIIRLHQGTLTLDSQINQGTTVTISIPCIV